MRKKLTAIFILSLALLFLANPHPVLASAFNLKSIGSLNTDGKLYPQWWYSNLQPTLAGEAIASNTIDIVIDTEAYQTTADASGNWSFTPPTALTAGDHSITLTSDGSSINFTLTLGTDNVEWDSVGTGSATLPTVGFVWPTFFLLLTGLPLILFSHYLRKAQ